MKTANILLVEDNKYSRKVALNILSFYNCIVSEAENGADALKLLVSRDNFDIILMDLQMPVMDGFEATKKIRTELGLKLPIVALTANNVKSEVDQCIKIGINDYLTKPFEEENFIHCIMKWIKMELNKTVSIGNIIHERTNALYSLKNLIVSSNNDKAYIQKMIYLFIEQTQLSVQQIKEAYTIKDLQTISKIAHRIKPSMEGMGIDVIKSDVNEIEEVAKTGFDSEILKNKIMHISTILLEIVEQLKTEAL